MSFWGISVSILVVGETERVGDDVIRFWGWGMGVGLFSYFLGLGGVVGLVIGCRVYG